jgi:hypothetical protein
VFMTAFVDAKRPKLTAIARRNLLGVRVMEALILMPES